jgi:hypothetical protein
MMFRTAHLTFDKLGFEHLPLLSGWLGSVIIVPPLR